MFAVNLETGRKLWQRDLHADYQVPPGYFGAGGSPLVDGGNVILNVGGRGAGVVALDVTTGREVWKPPTTGASYASPVVTTIAGRRVCCGVHA